MVIGFSYDEFMNLLSDGVQSYIDEFNDNTVLFKSPYEDEYHFLEVREDPDADVRDVFLAGFGWMDKDMMLDFYTQEVANFADLELSELDKTIKENPLRVIGDLVSWYGLVEFTIGYGNPWKQLLPEDLDDFTKKYVPYEV